MPTSGSPHHHRAGWIALAAAMAAAEWLREPGWLWVAGTLLVALGGVVESGWRQSRRDLGLTILVGLLAISTLVGQLRIGALTGDWASERERRLGQAYQQLRGELRGELVRAQALAREAAPWAEGDRERAFAELDRMLPRGGAEMAVVILEPTGVPWAWAGRHRLVPAPEGDAVAARFTRVYGVLESRAAAPANRVVVTSVLLWADSATPRFDQSLAARFGDDAGVELRVFAPGEAPRTGDIFDYTEPTTAGDRLLFSVQPIPPEQAAVVAAAMHSTGAWTGCFLLLVLLAALVAARRPLERFGVLALLVWAASRAPLGEAVGAADFFSSATFLRTWLSPLTRSAGNLVVASLGLLAFGVWLRNRALPRHLGLALLGGLVLLGTPYLIADLARGITPPATGVTPELWSSWQLALALATSALIVLGGVLLGARDRGDGGWWSTASAMGIGVGAAVLGLVVWQPHVGWPAWYTFLWLPALFLLARPAPRLAAILGTAVVAGSAASLVTWGAELNGRIVAAQRDLARLGPVEDPLAEPLLERLGDRLRLVPEPGRASELYLLWRGSDLAGQEFPVRLALWESDGTRVTELALDSLDLPTTLLASLVRAADTTRARSVQMLQRVPGRHYVLLERLPSGRLLTAAVGPRTRLLAPTRLARLVRPPPEGPPLYEIALSPPFTVGGARPFPVEWTRAGAAVRTDRMFALPGGERHVHAGLTLRPVPLLLVRGALLLVLDAAVVGLIWWLTTLEPAGRRSLEIFRRRARSFRFRIAITLALFFVIPAAAFTVWGLGRLESEASRTRDLLLTSVLRDAVLTAGGLLEEPADYLDEGLRDLSNRLEADLLIYSGGRLISASAPILEELALLEPLMDARSFQRLALGDELELTRRATTYVAPVRVGYRVAQVGPPGGIGILATPQVTYDWGREQGQRDLTFLLLFATVAGIGSAVLAAQVVARTLARPVADLGRSARAVGQGAPLPEVATPPPEFEQVFGAFDRMAKDIQASQQALEGSRKRTAQVLATVATGVVALDPSGRIVLANQRAAQLAGVPLPEGAGLAETLGRGWQALLEVAGRFLAGTEADISAEVDAQGRTYRVQLARLGAPGGAVLALDDLTDVTQAARVLAWGEMARQVAHEIKNPLTPIRLGVQHLRRVSRERPAHLDQVLDDTVSRILAEIDRLDTIARAFSRFGLPAREQAPLADVDLGHVVREVAALYRLSDEGIIVEVEGAERAAVPGRLDEIKEVLGNLLENARNAAARRILVRVRPDGFDVCDDGQGIAAEQLPRLFEPRFSTTTSGAGLGLPIVRRLVEGWGARVTVRSEPGAGTEVSVRWDGMEDLRDRGSGGMLPPDA